ncbi:MAG: sugar phosphate nucleotidyltransferase [bacterium]
MTLKHIVIPAAGIGTRMLPATRVIAKEMLPVYNKPVIQYVVEEAVSANITDAVFVTSLGKESIVDHFDNTSPRIPVENLPEHLRLETLAAEGIIKCTAVRQKKPEGLGHAVLTGASVIPGKPYGVMLPDVIIHSPKGKSCMQRMVDLYNETSASVVALMEVPDKDRERYGMVKGKNHGEGIIEITSMSEKPGIDGTDSNLAIVGRYVFSPLLTEILPHTTPGRNNEIQLTDAIKTLSEKEPVYGIVAGKNEKIFDTGTPEGYVLASAFMAAEKHSDFMSKLNKELESK